MQAFKGNAISDKAAIINALQKDIQRLQKFNSLPSASVNAGLSMMKESFPNGSFPLGAIHEFIAALPEDAAATNGFVSSILSSLIGDHGRAIWISASRSVFPPALKSFGIDPDRILFVDLQKENDVLWTMEEALKCSALSVVIAELKELSFTNSRRLQLAVEESQLTGFILRSAFRNLSTTACISRWKISSLPSVMVEELPGIGFPNWKVELLRMRNGKPGAWELQWRNGKLTSSLQARNEVVTQSLPDIRIAG